jgi:hypothetical protein
VRFTIDIPKSLYRELQQCARQSGRSVEELVHAFIGNAFKKRRSASKRVQFPLITSDGPKVDLTNERIYEIIPFP